MFNFEWFDCTDFDLLDNAGKQKRLFDFIDSKAVELREDTEKEVLKETERKKKEQETINKTITKAQWLWFIGDGSVDDFLKLWVDGEELERHPKLIDKVSRFVYLFNKHIQ